MKSVNILLLLAGFALSGMVDATPAHAAASAAVAQVAEAASGSMSAQGEVRGGGLPIRTPPPRTLHDFWPVFAGFAAAWMLIAGYTLSFNRRLRSVSDGLVGVPPEDEKGGRGA